MASKSSKETRGSDVDHIREQLEQGIGKDNLVGRSFFRRMNYLESGLKTNIRGLEENDEYEVYFSGKSTNGALLNGEKEVYQLNGFEKFTKYGINNSKKLMVPKGQLKFIDIGLQFTVVMTTLNETFLFGDFVYGSSSSDINPLGRKLPILMQLTPEVKINYFPDDPVAMLCGEQYVAVLDSCNRLWYCGIEKFGTGNHNCTYDFVEIGLKKYLETEFVDEPTNITHFRVGGRHLCFCINNKTIISTGANYYGQLGVANAPELMPLPPNTSLTVASTMSHYTFVKSWNTDGKYRVRDVACSGNMTGIFTECGKLFKTSNASESIQSVSIDGFSLTNISGNWTHILAHTSKNQMMGVTDNHVTEFFKDAPIKSDHVGISTGTNSNSAYYVYSNNELYDSTNPKPVLKTSLPIVVCKVTSEATMVLCMNFKSSKSIIAMKRNLIQCTVSQGLSDILIHAQQ